MSAFSHHLAPYYPDPPARQPESHSSDHEITISNWIAIGGQRSLIGSFTATLKSGIVLNRLMVNRPKREGASEWIGLPGAAQLEFGQVKRSDNGRILYHTLVGFATNDLFNEFEQSVLKELRRCGHI